MDCLRSFVLSAKATGIFASPQYANWNIGTERYWQVQLNSLVAYNIQGFKNINIHGIDVIGDFCTVAPLNGIVDDWRFNIQIIGQAASIGGVINPAINFITLNQNAPLVNNFELSRYKSQIELSSPIQSATQINFTGYAANGYGNQDLININLEWNLNFIFHYNFEGE